MAAFDFEELDALEAAAAATTAAKGGTPIAATAPEATGAEARAAASVAEGAGAEVAPGGCAEAEAACGGGAEGEDLGDLGPTSTMCQALAEEPLLCTDVGGTPRGSCRRCGSCRCTACWLPRRPFVQWRPVGDGGGGEAVEEEGAAAEACETCGCPASEHENLGGWRSSVLGSLRRFRAPPKGGRRTAGRELPLCSRLPAAAAAWLPDDVAFFALSAGVFDPRRHGRQAQAIGTPPVAVVVPPPSGGGCGFSGGSGGSSGCDIAGAGVGVSRGGGGGGLSVASPATPSSRSDGSGGALLVSVITPTSAERHPFHPLLYACFRAQTYEPKELVVIDCGCKPSQYLQARAREDPRMVYRWFDVRDARMQDLSEAILPERQPGLGQQHQGLLIGRRSLLDLGRRVRRPLHGRRLCRHR
mmetsp:Transcript_127583/g.408385  ORF Transcript_127583/g.408385 Transcript_127583/m.408385 type:complete len:415 (-) Transcript_127583:1041-2285(-)